MSNHSTASIEVVLHAVRTNLGWDKDTELPFSDEGQRSVVEMLPQLLEDLEEIGYTRKDVAFALDVDPLTVNRWAAGGESRSAKEGRGLKTDTLAALAEFLGGIVRHKSQKRLKASDSGFVTWRYFLQQQQQADRIWYISSSRFIASRSLAFNETLKNMFVKERQEQENRNPPVLVYIYPRGSETQNSLLAWAKSMYKNKEALCGTVIGIADDSLGWFLPGVRATMLEKHIEPDEPPMLEGYLRVQLPDYAKHPLLAALDPLETEAHTPWLSVGSSTLSRWYLRCKDSYADIVDKFCQNPTKFELHFHDAQSERKFFTGTAQEINTEEIIKALHDETLAGRRLRVVIEPDNDFVADFPASYIAL